MASISDDTQAEFAMLINNLKKLEEKRLDQDGLGADFSSEYHKLFSEADDAYRIQGYMRFNKALRSALS